ncbi:MAG: hypothetical protein ACPGVU_01925 [Limisphaerales bacterium]
MKSPKDILLTQHADATRALDAIRNQVVADLRETPRTTVAGLFAEAWSQLFWEPRKIWASLAAVWSVLLIVGATSIAVDSPAPKAAENPPPKTPVWERYHNALRAELGLPMQQRTQTTADTKPDVIHQSRNRNHFIHA